MKNKLLTLALLFSFSSASNAVPSFVGSWQVDEGPNWYHIPNYAYTGQEAAALLFGGNPTDYVISTIDNLVANIDYMSWYTVIGWGTEKFAQDYSSKLPGGYYYNGGNVTFVQNGAASAYTWDNAIGENFTNFAFRVDGASVSVPEASAISMLFLASGFLPLVKKRRVRIA